MMETGELLERICRRFCITGSYQGYEEIKIGNVNRTYRVDFLREGPGGFKPKSYLLQRVNTYVFRQPEALMDNVERVTEYLHAQDPRSLALHYHHTAQRKAYFSDDTGFWRLCNYIPSSTYNTCGDLEIVRSAGGAFGEFQRKLSAFDPRTLHETIPGFHDTRKRFAALWAAAKADAAGRAAQVRPELAWLRAKEEQACTLTQLRQAGALPLRVTHNDTKINNVLFAPGGRQALVVIDLDTVMPGLVGDDFGDAVRFAANRVPEDSPETDRAGIDLQVFRAFAQGFLAPVAASLTPKETDTLAISCFTLTAELAARFLCDYLEGDPYFKILSPTHNLLRARCQIALAQDMLAHLEEMDAIIHDCVRAYR